MTDPVELHLGPRGREIIGGRELALGEHDALVALGQRVKAAELEGRDDAQRLPSTPGATRATGAVHVDLGVLRERIVDDVADVRDVDATRGHVGRNQEPQLAITELAHDLLARGLGQITRQGVRRVPVLLQHVGDQAGLLAGVAEHDRNRGILEDDDVEEIAGLDRARGWVVGVIDLGRGDLVAGQLDADRVPHVAAGDPFDVARDRGREQAGLPLLRARAEDRPNVLQEAHGEHLVALVEHDRPDPRQIEGPAADVIQDPARGADDRVDPSRERVELRRHGGAAVDRQHVDGAVDREPDQLVADLLGQLARGQQHDQLDAGVLGRSKLEPTRQPRQAKRAGLAAAGLRLDQDIRARDHGREGAPLDRGRGCPAERLDGRLQPGWQLELLPGGGRGLRRDFDFGLGAGPPCRRSVRGSFGLHRLRLVWRARRASRSASGGTGVVGCRRGAGRLVIHRRDRTVPGGGGGLGAWVVRFAGELRLVRSLVGPRGLGHRGEPSSALSSARAAADCCLRSRSRACSSVIRSSLCARSGLAPPQAARVSRRRLAKSSSASVPAPARSGERSNRARSLVRMSSTR
ncbi:hypothetical protein DB30_01636 [Enhygromyxa salina]|uniref:Uncharacterized protein n=1 Tax=Enhygromyxa salina TaxID=215803 RepID=A0A0C2CRN3_9BACT|nr:hypothetical protein DB30_01636 [Enhygromyxa salina]